MPTQNPTPFVSPAKSSSRTQQKESAGPIIGAAVIVILLIFGGLYFWSTRSNHQNPQDTLPFITGDATQ